MPGRPAAGERNHVAGLALRTVAMTDATNRSNLPQVRSGPLIVGGILAGTGAMLMVAGMAIGS
jgi:hypothetical protein